MSVTQTHYAIYGSKVINDRDFYAYANKFIECEPYDDDAWKELFDSSKPVCFIDDPMGGEFLFVGRVLVESDEYTGFDGVTSLDATQFPAWDCDIRLYIEELAPSVELETESPKIHIITRYS